MLLLLLEVHIIIGKTSKILVCWDPSLGIHKVDCRFHILLELVMELIGLVSLRLSNHAICQR
jgi:hypothetical protein